MSENRVIRIRDVMQNNYAIVDGLITVAEAVRIAKRQQIKALIIDKRHENDEFGIVLMNDIAKKVLAMDHSPERTNVYEIMTKPALTVNAQMDVRYCARLFERFGISRAPVVEDGQIIGMVSYNNIVLNGMLRDE